MPRTGITYQDVEAVAAELLTENKPLTNEQIRLKLGTGSSSTIARYLRQFKEANRSQSLRAALVDDLPPELLSVVKNLWFNLAEQTHAEITNYTNQHASAFTALTQQLQKFKTNNRRWQMLHEKWLTKKNQLQDEKLTFEQALTFKHREVSTLLLKQENLFQQLNEKQIRIDELHDLHNQTKVHSQKQYQQLQTKHETQNKHNIDLQKKLAKVTQQSFDQAAKIFALEQQTQSLAQEKLVLTKEKASLAGQLLQVEKGIKLKKKTRV